jgi:pimeloyl-ACP methyl ester carboxylesterase
MVCFCEYIWHKKRRSPGFVEVIDIPSMFIQPEKGVNKQEWQLKPYKTYLRNLSIARVPGNHWPFLTAPEIFNQTVQEFLTVISGN